MTRILFFFLIIFLLGCKETTDYSSFPRNKIKINADWQFIKNDAATPKDLPANLNWRNIDLPHDWAIEGPFTREVSYKGGYLPYPGVGWYRKSFQAPIETERLILEFDGVMRDAQVYLNGEKIGGWKFGYTSFAIDISEKVKKGAENLLEVRVENQDNSSRWYPGSGIYRNVYLTYTSPIHVAHWGTFVSTPEVKQELAKVKIETTIQNKNDKAEAIELQTLILMDNGTEVLNQKKTIEIAAKGESNEVQNFEITNPSLWDLETPNMYKVVHSISQNGKLLDTYETPFGIRTFHFDADQGFFLNGKHVKLQGVNLHHDLGPLGAAVYKRATERQLEIMKEMGVNAIRTAHNPPSIEQLDLCDKMGLLVINETFDTWDEPKYAVQNDYSIWFNEWYERDTEALIKRDRNHPSVIIWSIGNEVMNMGTDVGKKNAKAQAAICKRLDPTRLVMAGVHLTIKFDQELREVFDVFGMNYWQDRYDKLHAEFPDLPLIASESSASLSSRSEYHFPVKEVYRGYLHESKQITSYDLVNTGFGTLPDNEFNFQKAPWMAGQFVWSGFDYHGEPDPYEEEYYPAHSSYFGIVDMCGFKKDRFYLYQSQWSKEPMIHILPHWNWEGREGEITPVFIYSNCAEVELIVNGKSQGKRKNGDDLYRFKWENIKYQPGSIKAIGYDADGKSIVEKEIKTTGAPAKIELVADRNSILADSEDLSFITAKITDANDNICPDASNLIQFKVEGEGELIALGNGDPTCIESYQGNERSAFHGLALLIVKSNNNAGEIKITASAKELENATLTLQTQK